VKLLLEPRERGEGVSFVNRASEEEIPEAFVEAVREGALEEASRGVLAGHPLVDLRVVLEGGSCVLVDASESAYSLAAQAAFREAARRAGVALLEPVMSLEVIAPTEFLGDVIGDLNSRRGRVGDMEPRGILHRVRAQAPLSELFGYATQLRSLTQGRGTHSLQFDHYAVVPRGLSAEVAQRRG
jgi:elongation factor G